MKNILKIGSVLATASAAILLFCLPLFAQEREAEPIPYSPVQEKAVLELRAPDLIDSYEYTPTIINAEGKVESLPVKTKYFYAADPVVDKTIFQDGDSYANTELLPDGRYRVYAADAFVYADGQWRTIENAEIDPAAFESVMLEQMDPTLGDLLSGVFKAPGAFAQETVYASNNCYMAAAAGSWAASRSATEAGWDPFCPNTFDYAIYTTADTIYRTFMTFDLSALSGTVESGSVNAWCNSSETIHVIPAAISNPMVRADWDQITFSSLSSETFSGSSEYQALTLNATGESYFDNGLGDEVDIALVNNNDYSDSPGTGQLTYCYTALYTGTDHDPYLELTITEEEPDPEPATTTPQASTTPGYIDFENVLVLYLVGGLLLIFLLGSLYALWPTSL